MDSIRAFFKKLWQTMTDPRYEKPLLIALPCLSLLLAALILFPGIRGYSRKTVAPEKPNAIAEVTAAPTDAPKPSPSPTPKPEGKNVQLTANSVDRDIHIQVCDGQGASISGEIFRIDVQFPDGGIYSYDTETDGSVYLVELRSGEYLIDMREKAGYDKPDTVKCTVSEEANYYPIENIAEVVDIYDVTQISQSEVKPVSYGEAPGDTVAEVITTPEEAKETGEIVLETKPAVDANGNPLYTYEYKVGPNGYLLLRGTEIESDVLPIDEDEDGYCEYGLRFITETPAPVEAPAPTEAPPPPEPSEEGGEAPAPADPVPTEPVSETPAEPITYSVTVELYKADNSPVDEFEIIATPRLEEITQKVGWQQIDGKMYYYYPDGSHAVGLKNIDGRVYYFNVYGVKASSVGIDVSYYNKDINWSAVRAQGIDFAIVRLGGRGWSSGKLYDDIRTQEYLRGARAAGLKVGAYFYSTAINAYEAVEEASVALNTLGGIALDYPIFIDMEWSGEYPAGRSDRMSPSEAATVAVAFCETIHHGGYAAGVYASQNYFLYNIDYTKVMPYSIWLASYTWNNQLPAFGWRYDMWQFTDRGLLNGINGYVDLDVIF